MDVATEKYNLKKGRLPGAIGCRREVDIDHTSLFRGWGPDGSRGRG